MLRKSRSWPFFIHKSLFFILMEVVSMNKVIVYSAEWCPWCTKVKEWLTQHKIKFEVKDVDRDQKYGEELLKKTGQTGIPVTFIDENMVLGFNVPELKKYLKL